MTTPHIHAKLIKAWADGHAIQYRAVPNHGEWRDAPEHLIWEWSAEYRIKPAKKSDRVVYPQSAWDAENRYQYLLFGKLKLVFDGESGELKSAEVV